MIIPDTNVLVRYLAQDDPRQSDAAARLFESAGREPDSILLLDEVLIETVWVLQSALEARKEDVIGFFERLLSIDAITYENDTLMRKAVDLYRNSSADFADVIMVLKAESRGGRFFTFDRKILRAFPERAALPE